MRCERRVLGMGVGSFMYDAAFTSHNRKLLLRSVARFSWFSEVPEGLTPRVVCASRGMPGHVGNCWIRVLFQKKTTWTEFRGSGFQDRGWALEVRGSGIGEETQEAAAYLVAMPHGQGWHCVRETYGENAHSGGRGGNYSFRSPPLLSAIGHGSLRRTAGS